jgi:PAS domain S-box-containing protein
VLVGWWLDLASLKSVFPGLVTMKANTALAFLLAGASLFWLRPEAAGGRARWISRACAVAVSLIGLLTLGEYLLGWDAHIDELLFRDPGDPGTSSPGRMAPTSAAGFLLLGLALLFLDAETRRGGRPAQALTLVPMVIAWLALIGYLYGVEPFYGIASYTQTALHTALAFLALGAGVLLARSDRGWMATITGPSAGGAMARRLLPASVVLPLVLGWGKLFGRRADLYETEFGLSLVVVLTASAFAVIVWRSARSLDRRDAVRGQTEAALAEREARFRGLLESAPDAVVIVDARGRIVLVNAQADRLFGYRRESLLDQPLDLLLPDRFRDRHAGHRAGYFSDPRPRAMGVGADLYARREDGSEFPVDVSLSPLATEQGPLVISAIRDITERKRAELEMSRGRREAEVLAEVARMIVAAQDLDVVLQGVGEAAVDLCAADLSSVALREPARGAMVFRHWSGARGLGIGDLRIEPGKGMGGQVLVTGRPFRTDNYAEDPGITKEYIDAALTEGVVAVMAVPIWYDGRVEGLLYVQNRSARPFTDRDEAVLRRLADHAAVAIAHAYLFAESERRRRAAEMLLDAGRAVVQGLSPEEVAQRIVESVRTALQGQGAALYRADPGSGVLTALAVAGYVGRVFGRNLAIPPGTGAIGLAAQELCAVVTSDALADGRLRFDADIRAALQDDPMRAVAAVPMTIREQMIGVLTVVDRAGRVFSEEETRLAQALADDAALALDNARLDENVRGARDFLQSIIDSSVDAILTTDARGRITSWSPGASEMFGYPAAEVLGRPVSEFYRQGPADARVVMRRLMAEQRVSNYETGFRATAGRWVEVSTSVSLLRDAGGTIVGTLGIMKDVTEQKRAGESLTKLSSAVEYAGDAVFITDRAGVIEHVNPAFENLTGYTREEAVGQTPRLLKSGAHPPASCEDLWRSLLAGDIVRWTFLNRKKDGALFYEERLFVKSCG